MSAIAPLLLEHLPADSLIPWAKLDLDWQRRIGGAVGAAELPPVNMSADFPATFVAPQCLADLSQVLALAHQHRWPLLLCGQGSKLAWGAPLDQAAIKDGLLVLSTCRFNRLLHHAAADLTVTVEAGLSLEQLQGHLAQQGQFLPLDPSVPGQASLGGIIATADAGSLRHRYGGVRDLLLGIQFVRADGQMAKAGGRVVKNVAGYDLMKLFTGAYGSLGLITEATFKTFPLLDTYQTVVLSGELEHLAQAAQAIAPSTLNPIAFDWFSPRLSQGLGLAQRPAIALRFGSLAASTAEQSQEVRRLGEQLGLGVQMLSDQPEQSLWQSLTAALDGSPLRCKLGVLPSNIPTLLAQIQRQDPQQLTRLHQGSGLGQLCAQPGAWEPDSLRSLRQQCDRSGGFLTLQLAPPSLKQQLDAWGYGGNAQGSMASIRQQFDPHQLLNPGRFLV